jgi:putative ABC transport system permease protein
MRTVQLLKRNLTYYWRTNLSVVLGVATAVTVLAGALLVGDSVRASLRDLFLQRLGKADYVISAPAFFRAQLAADLEQHQEFKAKGFSAACPLIALRGTVLHEKSRRQGGQIRVYAVDERFWRFHNQKEVDAPRDRDVFVGEGLARELGSVQGDSLLLRVERPSDIPIESLHGRKEDQGRTLRLTMRGMLPISALGEFSPQPQQGSVRAVFVSLGLLQKELEQENKVNTILVAEARPTKEGEPGSGVNFANLERILNESAKIEDFGVKLRLLEQEQGISLETESMLVSDVLADAAKSAAAKSSLHTMPVLAYLANSISSRERSVPYSLVAAIPKEMFQRLERGDAGTPGRGDAGTQGPGEREKGRSGEEEKGTTGEEQKGRSGEEEKRRRGEVAPSPALPIASSRRRVPASPRPGVAPSPRPGVAPAPIPPILLNDWAARDLGVELGDPIALEYYLWHDDGRLETRAAHFQLVGIVPISGLAADRELVPHYPGITETEHLSDWDPPFPIDLGRVRKQDENYWERYRTTPKAFIPLENGQQLWHSRFGKLTSLRISPADGRSQPDALIDKYSVSLRAMLDPAQMGFHVFPARAHGLEASRGATNFGEYFLYFSFFLVISALLLTVLFFKLGVEQRLREIGTLEAMGFPPNTIRNLFLTEGFFLSVMGSLIGLAGAVAYGQLLMHGLRTWWVDAVGTTMLVLHVNPITLVLGAASGIVAALICIALTLRSLAKASARSLLLGTGARGRGDEGMRREDGRKAGRYRPRRLITVARLAVVLIALGSGLLVAAALGRVGEVAGFFGGGTLLLVGLLCSQAVWLRQGKGKAISGTGWWPVSHLGLRNTTYRPGRSILCIALIASAAFIIVAVDAFRRDDKKAVRDRRSGSGGFPLLAESLLPLVHDPNSPEGREALNLTTEDSEELKDVSFTRFRVRAGDDASCLNLYQPRNPRIVAPDEEFIRSGRFTFQASLANTSAERENPWLLLNEETADGAIPVIGDANSLTYVLHLKLGDELVLDQSPGPVRLRVVAALSDSIFQSELLMAEKNFLHLFPQEQGHRFFLMEAPSLDIAASLEDRLSDYGFDVLPTSERLAEFHRVENTYLSTFQLLGGLGIVLGTLGMAAVLLRNVLERRRELALLRAVGYNSTHFTVMVIAENAVLLFCGLFTGVVCALLAVAPMVFGRGSGRPNISLALLLLLVLISGLIASLVATLAALRSPLLPALKAE